MQVRKCLVLLFFYFQIIKMMHYLIISMGFLSMLSAWDLTLLHVNDIHMRMEETNKYSSNCKQKDMHAGECNTQRFPQLWDRTLSQLALYLSLHLTLHLTFTLTLQCKLHLTHNITLDIEPDIATYITSDTSSEITPEMKLDITSDLRKSCGITPDH